MSWDILKLIRTVSRLNNGATDCQCPLQATWLANKSKSIGADVFIFWSMLDVFLAKWIDCATYMERAYSASPHRSLSKVRADVSSISSTLILAQVIVLKACYYPVYKHGENIFEWWFAHNVAIAWGTNRLQRGAHLNNKQRKIFYEVVFVGLKKTTWFIRERVGAWLWTLVSYAHLRCSESDRDATRKWHTMQKVTRIIQRYV